MTQWHGYIAIENLALNGAQRGLIVDWLKGLGPGSHSQPAHLSHWRTRNDNDAVILEAEYNDANLTVDKVRNQLAGIFGVDPATVNATTQQVTYKTRTTPVVTYERGGTNYIRFALFGNRNATWEQSRQEVLAYLKANKAEWGD